MTLQEENRRNREIRTLMVLGMSRKDAEKRYDEVIAPKQAIERKRNAQLVNFYYSETLDTYVTVPR